MRRTAISVAIALGAAASAHAETVPLAVYRSVVRSAAARDKEALIQWRAIDKVRLPDGRVVMVDDQTRVDARLLDRAMGVAQRPTDANLQAKRILDAPEYRTMDSPKESALEKWFNDLLQRFLKWLRSLNTPTSSLDTPQWDGSGIVRGVLFVLAAGVAVLLGALGARFARSEARRRRSATTEDPDLANPDITDPLGGAAAAARDADYRQAVRLTYIATLHALRDAGALQLERSRTNGEYQRRLESEQPGLAELLAPVTERFDRVWYGQTAATEEDLTLARRQHDRIVQETAPV